MRKATFFCVVLCFFSSAAAVAAEWSIEPSVSMREDYKGNIRFTSAPHSGVWQTTLSPKIKLSSKTEASEVSGSAQMNFNRYAGEHDLDRNDRLFNLRGRLTSERDVWVMNASYNQDSTAESERLATGIVQTRTQRSALSLNPYWSRSLTENSLFRLEYYYQDIKYDNPVGLTDYTNQQATATWQYQLSEQDQVNVSANYSRLEYAPTLSTYPDGFPLYDYGLGIYRQILGVTGNGQDSLLNKSSTRGAQVGITHLFSETLRGSLSWGRRNTVTTATHSCNGDFNHISIVTGTFCNGAAFFPIIAFTDETRSTGSSLSASLDKQFEAAKLSGTVSREVKPSGSGLVETDQFGASLNKGVTENLSGFVDVTTYHTKYVGVAGASSRYYTLEPRLSWRVTEWWTLDTGYRYERFKYDTASSATTANTVYLNLTYTWPQIAVSR